MSAKRTPFPLAKPPSYRTPAYNPLAVRYELSESLLTPRNELRALRYALRAVHCALSTTRYVLFAARCTWCVLRVRKVLCALEDARGSLVGRLGVVCLEEGEWEKV